MLINSITTERFWQNVVVGENEDDCWGWVGRTTRGGIAVISVKATPFLAARVSYCIANGDVPDKVRVMRRCNDKLCTNPRHLEIVSPDTTQERILARINIIDDENSCWDWTEALNSSGYGKFSIGYGEIRVHRYMWELENGPVPNGMVVMHICDRPICCRPSHLKLGTPRDNIDDMMAKGRQLSGERNPAAILDWRRVREIRRRWDEGDGYEMMAKEYGVSKSTTYAIVTNRIWKE